MFQARLQHRRRRWRLVATVHTMLRGGKKAAASARGCGWSPAAAACGPSRSRLRPETGDYCPGGPGLSGAFDCIPGVGGLSWPCPQYPGTVDTVQLEAQAWLGSYHQVRDFCSPSHQLEVHIGKY